MTSTEIRKIADQLAEYHMRLSEHYKEIARINRGIADGLYDVYTVKWPVWPGPPPVTPVVWIMADGSSIRVNPREPA